jgi:PTS system glucose-specific IIC component
VKEGDAVTAGQLIAEVDLEVLRKNNIPTITPVILCNGVEGITLRKADGKVKGGKDFLMTLQETPAENVEKESRFSFDFLQKLGKVLMTVIAVMPAAGIVLSIGKLL